MGWLALSVIQISWGCLWCGSDVRREKERNGLEGRRGGGGGGGGGGGSSRASRRTVETETNGQTDRQRSASTADSSVK
ncbi:hypothetical protein HZH68_016538 [Vespula germanica]|uniref:Uncharacterized protein n=1 Tax=Vespula germanica TaxID=30212 RepID=A0A834MRV8_VESGE|nr:hypothetical protein HZH68_016538 [Vespula germanica]